VSDTDTPNPESVLILFEHLIENLLPSPLDIL
jgi:hypothetical protein